jgi:hypothetical protein
VPRFCIKLYPGIRLTAEENHGKTSVGVAEKRRTADRWALEEDGEYRYVYSKRRKSNWIGDILRTKCLLKLIIEGKVKGKRRQERRRNQLKGDLKEETECWNL